MTRDLSVEPLVRMTRGSLCMPSRQRASVGEGGCEGGGGVNRRHIAVALRGDGRAGSRVGEQRDPPVRAGAKRMIEAASTLESSDHVSEGNAAKRRRVSADGEDPELESIVAASGPSAGKVSWPILRTEPTRAVASGTVDVAEARGYMQVLESYKRD